MRRARFDQYEFPSFRSILASLVLWCVALLTPLLALYFILSEKIIYSPFLIVLCFGASYLLHKKRKKDVASYQARRDEAARKLFNAAISGDEQKFAVFLRPFYTTDKIKTTQTIMVPVTSSSGVTTFSTIHTEYKLEDMLVKAFRRIMAVIALGKPGETFGVGRLLADEESWQRAASELMRRASLIICLPSSRAGSQWEMNQIIRNDYLGKTVFIMPPDPSSWRWKQLREDWDLLRQQIAPNGITIPKYRRGGLLFSVDATGQCVTEKLRLDSSRKLKKAITRLSSPE